MIGQVTVDLAVGATVPDFDLWVQLYDVAPDGTAWNLSSPGTSINSSYRPLHVFGIVSLVTLTCCLVASLVFLPALVSEIERR